MEEWKKIKLKEVLTEVTERNKDEKVKNVLSVTNSQGFVKQDEYFEGTVHSQNISNYKIIRKNQFAYNPSRVNVGSIDILKTYDEGVLSPMYVVFKVDNSKLLPEYFRYYFQTHRFAENVKNNTQGSVRNSLSFKALSDFEYFLPPLEEQEKIIKHLQKIDNIIYKIEKQKNNFKKLKSNVLNKLYEKQCKEYLFKDIVIGKIRNGAFKKPSNVGNGYKLINVMDLYNEPIINEEQLELLNVTEKEYNLNKVDKEDLFFTRSSLKIEGIAKCNIYMGESKDVIFECHVMKAKINKNLANPYLIKNLFETKKIRNQVMRQAKTTTMTTIGQHDLENIKIKVPDKNLQNKIVEFLFEIDKYLDLEEKRIDKYRILKEALIQQLLTGKIRMKI